MRSPNFPFSYEPESLEAPAVLSLRPPGGVRRVPVSTAACTSTRGGGGVACASERTLQAENERLRTQNQALEQSVRRLRALSVTDALTGLPNHRSFHQCLGRELERVLRNNGTLALAIFDIDDFKALNDAHGHAVGDAVLARVAGVMQARVRVVDLLARYGGDEFVLIAPATSLAGALALAEKVRSAVADALFSVLSFDGPKNLRATVSAGVARYRGERGALFDDADRALYRAKAAGKDCVVAAE